MNVLLSLERVPELLLEFARHIDPEIRSLAIIEDGSRLAFEWIGERDYLGEAKGRPRDRGRRATSSDAILVGERADGRTILVIEWKFTENYPDPVDPRFRVETYRAAYESASIFRERPPILSFFQEPHYQLLRLSLLARAMIDHREFAADRAAVVHVVPARNRALRATTTPKLRTIGTDITTIWTSLLPGPQVRYVCVESEALFRLTPQVEERYGGLVERD